MLALVLEPQSRPGHQVFRAKRRQLAADVGHGGLRENGWRRCRPHDGERQRERAAVVSGAHHSLETTSSFSTPNTPSTSRALSPATVLSDSLSTTPSSVVR